VQALAETFKSGVVLGCNDYRKSVHAERLGEKNLLCVLMSEYKPYACASFENVEEASGFGKSNLSIETEAFKSYEKPLFEFRKKRPYEKGKKKRKKGKRYPLGVVWKSQVIRNCNSELLPD